MTRRIVQLAGARAEFALADDGTIWLWTGSGWSDASRGPLPSRDREQNITQIIPTNMNMARAVAEWVDDQLGPAPPTQAVAPEPRPLSLREEIDQKKTELVEELGIKPLKRGPGRPKKEAK